MCEIMFSPVKMVLDLTRVVCQWRNITGLRKTPDWTKWFKVVMIALELQCVMIALELQCVSACCCAVCRCSYCLIFFCLFVSSSLFYSYCFVGHCLLFFKFGLNVALDPVDIDSEYLMSATQGRLIPIGNRDQSNPSVKFYSSPQPPWSGPSVNEIMYLSCPA